MLYEDELSQAVMDTCSPPVARPETQRTGTVGAAAATRLKQELTTLRTDRDRYKESYEKAVLQHDALLTQHGKLKAVLSQTIDKLIKVNPALLKGIAFEAALSDPCADFEPLGQTTSIEPTKSLGALLGENARKTFMGTLDGTAFKKLELNSSATRNPEEMPFSMTAGAKIYKKPGHSTPKFTVLE
jgi:hypothetical protein